MGWQGNMARYLDRGFMEGASLISKVPGGSRLLATDMVRAIAHNPRIRRGVVGAAVGTAAGGAYGAYNDDVGVWKGMRYGGAIGFAAGYLSGGDEPPGGPRVGPTGPRPNPPMLASGFGGGYPPLPPGPSGVVPPRLPAPTQHMMLAMKPEPIGGRIMHGNGTVMANL